MEGMVNLAFILLGAKAAKGRETVAEKLWKFGGFILVKLIKKHNETTGTVLQRLIDCIISGQAVTQYTGEQCDITCTTTDAVSNMAHVIYRSWNMYIYTGCPRRNVPDFGRMFLMLNYTDITQNTYIQS